MPNRLAESSSPYLRQHAENPVDWYQWGGAAFERARSEEKPILLSVGYAACHWCHVMAHESFEDAETARLMNDLFVNVKVDREERPDVDAIYMQAVQALTGQGGWPMTVFLTPAGVPFFGGTYYPPDDRHGLPSFRRVLHGVSDAWRNKRETVADTARRLQAHLTAAAQPVNSLGAVDDQTLDLAFRGLAKSFDARHGGFGDAPKFPPSMALEFLLTHWARTGTEHALEMASQTFTAMARGGVYDQVGGGLHRYSVDARWLVPHFEKMLYDNALFARLGVHLWQATRDHEFRRVSEQTLDWAVREMRTPDGAFCSSLDADSEGEEGKFYVWTSAEIDRLLGPGAELAKHHWGVASGGNFEGNSILFVPHGVAATASRVAIPPADVEARLEAARKVLLAAREARVRPGRDDKVVAGWNGLMIRAFAEAARAFDRGDYREVAIAGGRFLADRMIRDERVVRSTLDARESGAGVLEDYASLGLAFLDLYSLTFDAEWFARGRHLATLVVDLFLDESTGAFFDTARDHEELIIRPREVTDNALPSGNSLAAELLMRVGAFGADERLREIATNVVRQTSQAMARHPIAFGHLLGAADMLVHGPVEVAIVGELGDSRSRALARGVHERFVPSLVFAGGTAAASDGIALLGDREAKEGVPTAYVCRRYVCDAPTREPNVLADQLDRASRRS